MDFKAHKKRRSLEPTSTQIVLGLPEVEEEAGAKV